MAGSYEGQYHPKLVTATILAPQSALGPVAIPGLPQGFNFPFAVIGRAADGFFTRARATDSVTTPVGAEGNAQHVYNADESGDFVITVNQGTLTCVVLSALYKAQSLIGEGQLPPFTFNVEYRDNNCFPAETHTGFNCLIARLPDTSFGASVGTLVWTFRSAQQLANFGARRQ